MTRRPSTIEAYATRTNAEDSVFPKGEFAGLPLAPQQDRRTTALLDQLQPDVPSAPEVIDGEYQEDMSLVKPNRQVEVTRAVGLNHAAAKRDLKPREIDEISHAIDVASANGLPWDVVVAAEPGRKLRKALERRRRIEALKRSARDGVISALAAYGIMSGMADGLERISEATHPETSVVIPDKPVVVRHDDMQTEHPSNPGTPTIRDGVYSSTDLPPLVDEGVGEGYRVDEEGHSAPNEAPAGSAEWVPGSNGSAAENNPLFDEVNNTGDPIDLPLEVEPTKPDDSPDSPENPATSADHSSSPEIKLYPDTPQQN